MSIAAGDAAVGQQRVAAIDALRGAAMVWMVLFHAAYDLNHFGWLQPRQHFLSDPFWTWQRVAIVSLFMFCAGVSQAAARAQGVPWGRFWRRWGQIVLCAAGVSLATYWVFPQTWIAFGVLHGLAVMVVVARVAAPWPRPVLALLACTALVLPPLAQHPLFDAPGWQWLGLVTRKPVTEDYAPVFPWLGMVLLGLTLGPRLLAWTPTRTDAPPPASSASGGPQTPQWLLPVEGLCRRLSALRVLHHWVRPLVRALAAWGRWPLTVYMVHQPLLWGLLLVLPRQ